MRQAFTPLVGNDELIRRLCDGISSSRMSHAYVIEGKKGSGKHTAAKLTAAAISCLNRNDVSKPLPCLVCPSCRKIMEDKSPDVIYVGREDKTSIGVEQTRFIKSDVPIAPNDLDNKIYIIEDAHTMTVQAQNALLLTLEEPPAYVLFLLLCENSNMLLETIRSRTPVLRTQPIGHDQMREYLIANDKRGAALAKNQPDQLDAIIGASDGCIGRAIELLNPKESSAALALRASAREFIECAAKKSPERTVAAINSFGNKRDEVAEKLNATMPALRDLITLKKDETAQLVFFTERESAIELADSFTSRELINLYDAVSNAANAITQKNANTRLTLINMAASTNLL